MILILILLISHFMMEMAFAPPPPILIVFIFATYSFWESDFNTCTCNYLLTAKLLNKAIATLYNKLRKTFSKFYHKHSELIIKCNVGFKTLFIRASIGVNIFISNQFIQNNTIFNHTNIRIRTDTRAYQVLLLKFK